MTARLDPSLTWRERAEALAARLGPPEGWLAVGLVYLLALTVAWAIDDAGWFLRPENSDYLQAAAIGGVTVGLVSARVGWARWTGYLVGACFAALLIPLWIGERLPLMEGASLDVLYRGTAESLVAAAREYAVHQRVTASQWGPTLMLVGILIWGSSTFAANAVFRDRRPMPAIVALGALLFINISLTVNEQLGYLVLFCGAALLLLVRLHALDEQTAWLRARLGNPRPVASHTLRAGTAFVVAAIAGSFLLTQAAHSAPLEDAWPDDVETAVTDVGRGLADLFPFVSFVRGPGGTDFSGVGGISNVWHSNDEVAFTAELPANAPATLYRDLYWRANTLDYYDPTARSWSTATEEATALAADESLLPIITDHLDGVPRAALTVRISPVDKSQKVAFSPALPVSVSIPTDVSFSRPSRSLVRVFVEERGVPYTVTAEKLVTWSPDNPEGVSANQLLAVADLEVPETIRLQYAQKPAPGDIGPSAQTFLNDIKAAVGDAPYAIAAEMERRFHNEPFQYRDDVREIDCGDQSLVECFMATKQGFCMYFATAMVNLLRQEGIPTRLVMGFLPGAQSGRIVTVRNNQAHAWVEVYFPTWGWIPFDPTRQQARSRPLPAGTPVSAASPGPRPSVLRELPDPRPSRGPQFLPPTTGFGSVNPALIVAAGVGLAAAAGAAYYAWRRRRGAAAPDVDGAYGGVVGVASRLGFAPRPSQTIYEYTEALATVVPVARADLMTVADARVETRYGGRSLGAERVAVVIAAAGRLRRSLLRLFLRRDRRRGVRRRR